MPANFFVKFNWRGTPPGLRTNRRACVDIRIVLPTQQDAREFLENYLLVNGDKYYIDENGCQVVAEAHRHVHHRQRIWVWFKYVLATHLTIYAATGVCAYTHPLVTTGGVQVNELDASHYCHNMYCILADHCGFEPATINAARRTCVKQKMCLGHTSYRNCMFFNQ